MSFKPRETAKSGYCRDFVFKVTPENLYRVRLLETSLKFCNKSKVVQFQALVDHPFFTFIKICFNYDYIKQYFSSPIHTGEVPL